MNFSIYLQNKFMIWNIYLLNCFHEKKNLTVMALTVNRVEFFIKGNNIRGTATETLGRTLRQNAYIQR